MTAEIQVGTFISGTAGYFLSGTNSFAISLLCGVSGGFVIPLKCNSAGFLMTTSGAL